MKKLYILTLIFTIKTAYSQGNNECGGELHSVNSAGSSISWLNKRIESINHHPNQVDDDPHGDGCIESARAIQVTTSGNNGSEKAYYFKNHDSTYNLRFRFLLDSYSLLESYEGGDSMVLYSFMYENSAGILRPFLKVRLTPGSLHAGNGNFNWELRLQWFDTVNGGSVYQKFPFKRFDNFIDFEFFWNSIALYEDDFLIHSGGISKAGVLVKVGDGINNPPSVFSSPFSYENISVRKGQSKLGAVNTSDGPLTFGDEIRILSPELYNNND